MLKKVLLFVCLLLTWSISPINHYLNGATRAELKLAEILTAYGGDAAIADQAKEIQGINSVGKVTDLESYRLVARGSSWYVERDQGDQVICQVGQGKKYKEVRGDFKTMVRYVPLWASPANLMPVTTLFYFAKHFNYDLEVVEEKEATYLIFKERPIKNLTGLSEIKI